jgi:sugar phosphate isomerase/epimerase
MTELSRRTFLQSVGAAALASGRPAAANQSVAAWKIGGFTKPIQDLSFDRTALFAEQVGWDGVELPLRAGGHVLPERVEEDLPAFVAALSARSKTVLALATDIRDADGLTERVLRAAVRSGIRRYRLGAYRYRAGVPFTDQLLEFRARLTDLAALNRELGVTGLIQNHSGNGYVGASLWDLHALIETFEPSEIGVHFDIGHATVEAGLSWPTAFELVKERVGAVIVKDFVWTLTPGRGGTVQWCPIGRGMIHPRFFTMLAATSFDGPITMQFEYPFENGSVEARARALEADNRQLRAWLRSPG